MLHKRNKIVQLTQSFGFRFTHEKGVIIGTWTYSADTRTMNAMAFFSLYLYFIFTYSVVIFTFFPELTNHIREAKQ